jgi:hypothetical protein
MKHFILGLSLLISASTFASTLEQSLFEAFKYGGPVDGQLKQDIIKALKNEITKGEFNCKWKTANGNSGPSNTDIKRQLKVLLDDKKIEIFVNDQGEQPIISSKKTYSPNNGNNEEVIVDYTTSSDLKSIVKVDAYKNATGKQEVNLGTLTNPDFQTIETRTSKISGSCSVN